MNEEEIAKNQQLAQDGSGSNTEFAGITEQALKALSDEKYLELQKIFPDLPNRNHIIQMALGHDKTNVVLSFRDAIKDLVVTPDVAKNLGSNLIKLADELLATNVAKSEDDVS